MQTKILATISAAALFLQPSDLVRPTLKLLTLPRREKPLPPNTHLKA